VAVVQGSSWPQGDYETPVIPHHDYAIIGAGGTAAAGAVKGGPGAAATYEAVQQRAMNLSLHGRADSRQADSAAHKALAGQRPTPPSSPRPPAARSGTFPTRAGASALPPPSPSAVGSSKADAPAVGPRKPVRKFTMPSREQQQRTLASLEVPREDVAFTERELGHGFFGMVVEARLKAADDSGGILVAVKTSRANASAEQQEQLRQEAVLMREIGLVAHPNVLALLAVVTRSQPMMLVTEHCGLGDLLGHLRNRRPHKEQPIMPQLKELVSCVLPTRLPACPSAHPCLHTLAQ